MLLIHIFDKLEYFDKIVTFICYKSIPIHNNSLSIINTELMNYKELPWFVKYLRDYFERLKIKSSSVCLYSRFYLLYTKSSNDIVEILKEEFSKEKL